MDYLNTNKYKQLWAAADEIVVIFTCLKYHSYNNDIYNNLF